MLLRKEQSHILLIDVQEKLTPHINNANNIIAKCQWLLKLAEMIGVSIQVSEQYPQGLGSTISPLQPFVTTPIYAKTTFSSWRVDNFRKDLIKLNKNQLILIGIETHVCILQTALDLLDAGYQVFIVVDAVGSRADIDHHYGLKRMKQAGAQLVTAEMIFFEWLEQAGSAQFKQLSKIFLQNN